MKTKIRAAIAFVIIAVLVAFVLLNQQEVEVNLIVGSVRMSRAVLVLAIFALGFFLGWILHSIVKSKSHSQ